MTIEDRLNDLITAKADMKSAIESKGVEVTGGLTTYADAIRSIESGGGGAALPVGTKFGYSTFEVAPLFDTSGYTDMSNMFYDCSLLTEIPEYDTSNVKYMTNTFYHCDLLTGIPPLNTSNVIHFGGTFRACSSLTGIPPLNTSSAIKMGQMFYDCSSLTTIPPLNTSKCEEFTNVFRGCTSLIELPELDLSECISISYTFDGCSKLTTLGGFINYGLGWGAGGGPTLDLSSSPLITYTSIMNVINKLYNRHAAGFSDGKIKLHNNTLTLLENNGGLATATSKGWIITS